LARGLVLAVLLLAPAGVVQAEVPPIPWRPLAASVYPGIDSTRVGLGYELDVVTSQLVSRCWRGRLQILVRSDRPFPGSDSSMVVRVSLDTLPAQVENWLVSTDRHTMLSRNANELAGRLLEAQRARFAIDGSTVLEFDVHGFDASLRRLRGVCPFPDTTHDRTAEVEGAVAIVMVSPEDPRQAPRSSANVILHCLVGEDGRVKDAKVIESEPNLHMAALTAAREWLFKPSYAHLEPRATWTIVQVLFQPPPSQPAESVLPRTGEYVHTEEFPKVITKVKPEYPTDLKDYDATVVVEALVSVDGRVVETRVVQSKPPFDEAAVAAVRQWKFRPAMSNGKPVAVWVVIPVKFSNQ